MRLKDGKGIDGLIDNLSLFRGKNLYLTTEDLAYQGVRSKIYCTVLRNNQIKKCT